LRRDGYRPGTLRLYRQILRDLRDFLRDRHRILHPASLTRDLADAYLSYLAEQNVSWSWLASVIAVLRNCFDRLGNMELTVHMVTPRRKWPLPETLHARELRQLFDALPNPAVVSRLRWQPCLTPVGNPIWNSGTHEETIANNS